MENLKNRYSRIKNAITEINNLINSLTGNYM